MRLLILGCGLMGPAAAYNAAHDEGVSQVTLCDRQQPSLDRAKKLLDNLGVAGKVATARLDIGDRQATQGLIASHDVVISALPQFLSAAAIGAANAADRPLVDLTLPPTAELPALKQETAEAGNLVVIGCGVDPGLSEIMGRSLAERIDRVLELHIKCGGIPEEPKPPLGYKIVFGGSQMPLREEQATMAENGRIKRVPRYSGLESFDFPEVGKLEAYHEGFLPWMLDLPCLKGLQQGTTKTVRWPGYTKKIRVLQEIGLLGEQPVEVDGVQVVPKHLLDRLLARHVTMDEQERDLLVFKVEVKGERDGAAATLCVQTLVRFDRQTGFTAMARVTAYTAAIVARMVGRGEFKCSGLLTPEQLVVGAHLVHLTNELARTGITLHYSGN